MPSRHRLRGGRDIGFAFVLTSASYSPWQRLRIILTSAPHSSWHRLRIQLDIGFAFVLTSASHSPWHRLRIILTSASHSSWHRLRIIWELYWKNIKEWQQVGNGEKHDSMMKTTKAWQQVGILLTSASQSSWHGLRIVWKLYWNNIKSNNKIIPIWPPKSLKNCRKTIQKLLKLLSNLSPNPFQHDMESNTKNIC